MIAGSNQNEHKERIAMKSNLSILILLSALSIAALGDTSLVATTLQQRAGSVKTIHRINGRSAVVTNARRAAVVRYRINTAQSRFMANVGSGGLLWFMGHSHHFAIRDFTGEAVITPESIVPSSLEIIIKAASLEEAGKNFTEQQKQIINKEAHEEVLEVSKYPEITFKSTSVTGRMKPDRQFEAKIAGDLTLHGVTRPIEIPAQVMVSGSTLHATGGFSINRSDYKVKTHSIKGGTIRVRNKIRFEFDMVANQI